MLKQKTSRVVGQHGMLKQRPELQASIEVAEKQQHVVHVSRLIKIFMVLPNLFHARPALRLLASRVAERPTQDVGQHKC
jgi:hypothetical protein